MVYLGLNLVNTGKKGLNVNDKQCYVVGSFCVDTSSPEGFLRSSDCDKLNNYICEIDENAAFAIVEGEMMKLVI